MKHYIETKVTYDTVDNNGASKRASELLVVSADSFTEAEARIAKQFEPSMGGLSVVAVRKSNIAEVWPRAVGEVSAADRWYKAKLVFISIDERTMREKRAASHYLVQGVSVAEALDCINYHMRGTVADFEVVAIAESGITDIYD